jgi:hypothetical protein
MITMKKLNRSIDLFYRQIVRIQICIKMKIGTRSKLVPISFGQLIEFNWLQASTLLSYSDLPQDHRGK